MMMSTSTRINELKKPRCGGFDQGDGP
jgi:hypothetical protein